MTEESRPAALLTQTQRAGWRSKMTHAKQYAFGRNRVSDCACPALSSSVLEEELVTYSEHPVGAVVKRFDEITSNNVGYTAGLVSDNKASEAWLEALEQARDDGVGYDALEAGEQVARELGWLEEE